jgi:hypothetical protein
MTLENMNGSLARTEHGTYENIIYLDMIGMLLCGLTLANTLDPEARVNQIFSYLKLPILISIEAMSVSDSCEFHIEFCDGVSHQYKLAGGQSLWVGRGCLEIGV